MCSKVFQLVNLWITGFDSLAAYIIVSLIQFSVWLSNDKGINVYFGQCAFSPSWYKSLRALLFLCAVELVLASD